MTLQNYLEWFKHHERLIVIILALSFGAWGYGKFTDSRAATLAARATVAEQALAAQKAADAQLALQVAQVTQQYQTVVQQAVAQNKALQNANNALLSALAQREQVNAQLPVSGLSQRIVELANAPQGSVSSTETQVILTQPGALAVTNALEKIPVLTASLTNETTIAQNNAAAAGAAQGVISAQTNQIISLQKTAEDSDKAHAAEVASLKAAARKSKFGWFKVGFVTGFVTGLFTGHAL